MRRPAGGCAFDDPGCHADASDRGSVLGGGLRRCADRSRRRLDRPRRERERSGAVDGRRQRRVPPCRRARRADVAALRVPPRRPRLAGRRLTIPPASRRGKVLIPSARGMASVDHPGHDPGLRTLARARNPLARRAPLTPRGPNHRLAGSQSRRSDGAAGIAEPPAPCSVAAGARTGGVARTAKITASGPRSAARCRGRATGFRPPAGGATPRRTAAAPRTRSGTSPRPGWPG